MKARGREGERETVGRLARLYLAGHVEITALILCEPTGLLTERHLPHAERRTDALW